MIFTLDCTCNCGYICSDNKPKTAAEVTEGDRQSFLCTKIHHIK
jgi:hypothetical protein